MKTIKDKTLIKDTLIFYGNGEYIIVRRITLNLPNDTSIIIELSFNKNKFNELENILEKSSIDKIIKECKFRKSSSLGIYKNTYDLTIYYFIKDNYLVLVSYGEAQPTCYVTRIEGVWEIQNNVNTK